jgi:hypothetical protein
VNFIKSPEKSSTWILLLCYLVAGERLFLRAQCVADRGSAHGDPTPEATAHDSKDTAQTDKAAGNDWTRKMRRSTDRTWIQMAQTSLRLSSALCAGILPVLGYITPIPAKDEKIEPPVFGAAGLITDNGSWGWGLGTELYIDKARYEVETIYAKSNRDYNLYSSSKFREGRTSHAAFPSHYHPA